ncbi:MAG: AlkZ family DNA glycosylase [Caulobacter sp.]|nr:AlkZ family DNA glycosylase [Caulobacter sp.]
MTAKPETLADRDLNRALLARQMLLSRQDVGVAPAIERLGGLQAQDARPPFIALWNRLNGFRREDLLTALHDRTVVKATFTRGTLHLVSAADYLAFRTAHASVLEGAMLTDMKEMAKVAPVGELVAAAKTALADGALTFADLRAVLAAKWPDLNERHMGYAVRLNLPLVATPDDSQWGGKAGAAFALADLWLAAKPSETPDVEGVIRRYLTAFGPATPADVQTFTGFKGVKALLEGMDGLATYRNAAGKPLYDVKDGLFADPETPAPVRLLADFDGVMLAHADRSRVLGDLGKHMTSKNLRVPAVFTVDGFVAGTWALAATKTKATLTVTALGKLTNTAKDEITAEGEALLRFVAPEAKAVGVSFS